MAQDMIRFDVLVQEALRGVVRKVLVEVARTGLPGEHHFYVSFDTTHPSVRISPRVRQRYPEEMTIVLQHQFWDLIVTDAGFEVGLSFGGIPEKLIVPFHAVKGFFDPSVQFGLQFEVLRGDEAAEPAPAAAPVSLASDRAVPERLPERSTPRALMPTPEPQAMPQTAAEEPEAEDEDEDRGPTVISLDQFRKKT